MNRISRKEFESHSHQYWLDLFECKREDYNNGLINSDEMWSTYDCILGDYGLSLSGIKMEPVASGELIMELD